MFSSRRGWLVFLARIALFLILFVGASEVWLRTITPAAERPILRQDAESTMRVFDSGVVPDGLNTVGRLALRGGEWRVNNDGWISAIDYAPAAERGRPLVALFGDSFVEALFVDVTDHIDAHLSRLLPNAEVYAFGRSGWYLEQYVATARYARERYSPDLLVILLNADDIEKSIKELRPMAPTLSLWQISNVGGGFSEVPPEPRPFSASWKTRLALRSAVVRYLVFNAETTLPGMANRGVPEPAAQADASTENQTPDSWHALLPAAKYMVSLLCDQNPGTPILFVFSDHDPSLRYLAKDALSGTPLFPDALAVQEACREHPQCYYLDLRPVFSADWLANQRRFEAVDGGHWNGYANEVVAKAVAGFIADNGLLALAK